MIALYTYQRHGHDITKPFAPNAEYAAGGAFADIADYLGWRVWVWCMPTLADFDNDWFNARPNGCVLWRLSVPAECVKWLALNAQCENCTPVESWFYSSADEIRRIGDIPQALINAPVLQEWVKVSPMITRQDVERILLQHPWLHFGGYGYNRIDRRDIPTMRAEMVTPDSIATIAAAVSWIGDNLQPGRCMNRKHSSYGLKHTFEQATGIYSSSGQFTVAMLLCGYRMGTPVLYNPIWNISEGSAKQAWKRAQTARMVTA